MSRIITESDVEQAALDILEELEYKTLYGPDIAPLPEGRKPERKTYSDVVLVERLARAIDKINPAIPKEAKEEAIKKVLRTESPKLIVNNQSFHRMLVNDIDVEYRKNDGRIAGDKVWLFDFDKPEKNEFLAVNQFTVIENNCNRRPDIVIFVNGLPLAVIELKNPADENATVWTAFSQFETYKNEIPSLFNYNGMLVISDGMEARAGTITSGKEWFMLWRTVLAGTFFSYLRNFPSLRGMGSNPYP
jgi:type I restriction enzyme R subunit